MTVGIVGLGYVGLPLAVAFAETGTTVVGVDVDDAHVRGLRAGESSIEDVPDERLRELADHLRFESSYDALGEVDAVLLCVPTPLSANREPDLGPLVGAVMLIAPPGPLVRSAGPCI